MPMSEPVPNTAISRLQGWRFVLFNLILYHGTVEGIVPGSGSVFATLPPDNATGNFIHIVQRVPIRIALEKGELLQQPIRPGLSTVTRMDVSNAGRSVWTSLTDTQEEEYHTDVFTQELQDAEALARETMGKNLRGETPPLSPAPRCPRRPISLKRAGPTHESQSTAGGTAGSGRSRHRMESANRLSPRGAPMWGRVRWRHRPGRRLADTH